MSLEEPAEMAAGRQMFVTRSSAKRLIPRFRGPNEGQPLRISSDVRSRVPVLDPSEFTSAA